MTINLHSSSSKSNSFEFILQLNESSSGDLIDYKYNLRWPPQARMANVKIRKSEKGFMPTAVSTISLGHDDKQVLRHVRKTQDL